MQELDDAYRLDRDAVWFECKEFGHERIRVLIRWGLGGPEDNNGRVAAHAVISLPIGGGNGHVFVKLEERVTIGRDFVSDLCNTYGVQGVIDIEVVRAEDVSELGSVRVK